MGFRDLNILAELMKRIRRQHPDSSFSVRKTDDKLWVASIKGKGDVARTVKYIKQERENGRETGDKGA